MSDAHAPAALVALRDRREIAIQRLSDSFVADLIGVEMFEDRLSQVHAATTVAAIDAVLADLAPLPTGAPTAALVPLTVDPGLAPGAKRLRALLSNVERRGGWNVPAKLQVSATFGNVELDFRDVRFTAPVTEIDARVIFGNLEITVPPQLAVECEVTTVLANSESHGTIAVADPGRPLLRIRGYAVLGNVEIHTRLPGQGGGWRAGWQKIQEVLGKKEGAAEEKEPRRLGPARDR